MAFKKTILPLAMLGALSLGSLACGPADYGYTGIDVGFGPPEARAEVSIESPGPGYYWVPGYYDWQDGNYIWVAGSWQRPEHDGDVWVAPRYERNGSRYRYYRGHWSGSRSGRRDNDRRDRDRDHDHDHG
jgi:hypothetical protein